MFVVNKVFSSEYKKDNSTFISYLMPSNFLGSYLDILIKEHKKAVHFTRASRVINNNHQIVESHSDGGEPRGSAGIPILNVMRGNSLVNCAIVVVRYFGGKLLGVGGLVRAYSRVSLDVISIAELVVFKEMIEYELSIDFKNIELVKYLCSKNQIDIVKFNFMQNFVIIHLRASKEKIENLLLVIDK